MQIEKLPVERSEAVVAAEAVVEPAGFTLVEEDDVAFSLRLCREVHRIYGDYQDGRLPPSDSVLAGLMVTVEMLAAMSQRVRDGMPGMRITVAAAQTREMLAVVFGRDPMRKPLERKFREQYRTLVMESVRTAAAAVTPVTPLAAIEPARRKISAEHRVSGWRRIFRRSHR